MICPSGGAGSVGVGSIKSGEYDIQGYLTTKTRIGK